MQTHEMSHTQIVVRHALRLLLFVAVLLGSTTALAAPTVAQLSETLSKATDFRVRVQAALALGATKNKAAVAPLCRSLSDREAAVRTAAAAALGRLQMQQGLTCLERRGKLESNQSAKLQIAKSIQEIKASASRPPDGSTKWYVAVTPTNNKTNRSLSEIDVMVQASVRKALLANPAIAVAPVGETPEQAQAVLDAHDVQGYVLKPSLDAPDYSNSALTVRVTLMMLLYPKMVLKGEFTRTLTMPDTPKEDRQEEDKLINMGCEEAVQRFITIIEAFKR